MTENMGKPQIRFSGFDDTWEQRKFGDCVLIQRGGSPRPIEDYITNDENGVNWIKIGDVAAGSRYITSTKEKIKPEGVKKSRCVEVGDLILSNSMSFGRPYIMQINGCIHDGWLLIRDEKKMFNLEYLLQLLSSDYMFNQYKALAAGGVVNNLNSELVQSTIAMIPSLPEQVVIGKFFSKLDNLITLHQRKYDKLTKVKKSMLDKMFPKNGSNVPEIRFKGFSDTWEQRKFGDCVLIQRGGSPRPIEDYITNDENGVNWIKIGDVAAGSRYITSTKEKIKPEGVKKSRCVEVGDLILSNSMSFGRPYIMQINGCIHDGWLLIRDEKKMFNLEYLLQLLSSDYMFNQYKALAAGGVVNNLNSELVQSTIAMIPSLPEQVVIGKFFSKLDNLITLHQRELEKLKNLKKACLEKMFV